MVFFSCTTPYYGIYDLELLKVEQTAPAIQEYENYKIDSINENGEQKIFSKMK